MVGLLVGTTAHIAWWTAAPRACVDHHVAAPVHIHTSPALELPPPSAAPPPSCTEATVPLDAPRGAVVCTPRGCDIRRSFLRHVGDHNSFSPPPVRLVPHHRRGKFDGLKLYSIRRGSPLALLGMQNGDRLTAINDRELRSADDLGPAIMAGAASDTVALTVVRKGEPRTFFYRIVAD